MFGIANQLLGTVALAVDFLGYLFEHGTMPERQEIPPANVLVVDDEASIRQVTRQTLEAFGYQVLLASNGSEAVSMFQEHEGKIAVVLTDMMMPAPANPSVIPKIPRRFGGRTRSTTESSAVTTGESANGPSSRSRSE